MNRTNFSFLVLIFIGSILLIAYLYQIGRPANLLYENDTFSLENLDNKANNLSNNTFSAKNYIGLNRDANELSGKGISVVIIDSGIDPDHIVFTNNGKTDVNNKVLTFYDVEKEHVSNSYYDDSGHGTGIASILGGSCNEYSGVAPSINFIIVRLPETDTDGYFEYTSSELEDIVDWIIDNKEVFNIKIASISFGQYIGSGRIDTINELNQKAEKLIEEGILVVGGAGNEGNNGQGTIGAPSSSKSVLSVGGVNMDGSMCDFSSRGPTHEGVIKPDVCSVATDVYMAQIDDSDDEFGHQSGTSFATPLVAGLAALLLESDNDLSPQELKNIISLTSIRTINPYEIKDNYQGWGVVQGYAALDALKSAIKINRDTKIKISLDEDYSIFCQKITLDSGHFFFELKELDSTSTTAEMYLFDTKPDEFGEPVLISNSINLLTSNDYIKKMGAFVNSKHSYYLVVKLTNRDESGEFIVSLIIEYRLIAIFILVITNILVSFYEVRYFLKFRNSERICNHMIKKKLLNKRG